jgi:hypothetical protein
MESNAARRLAQESPDIIWFVARGSILKGPFTTDQLQAQIQRKDVSHLDFCWRQGFREWRPIASVSDFDRRQEERELPSYPSVEVPCAPEPTLRVVADRNSQNVGTNNRRIQVSFSKTRRHSISAYEWGFAIIFSVAFAYFASVFALEEVRRGVEQRLSLWTIGLPGQWGQHESSLPPQVWSPLYSAPGFVELAAERPSDFRDPQDVRVSLPVEIEGHVQVGELPGEYKLGPYVLKTAQPDRGRAPASVTEGGSSWDPVYSRSIRVRAFQSPRDASVLWIHEPGEPLR